MSVDKVTVEVIRNACIFIAEEMGIVLRRTAYSPNIKDRLDMSCAIFSSRGELVAQAEHIPVHLGSMTVCVENTLKYLDEKGVSLSEGDVVIVNDPYIAGTHLNDITLIKPFYFKGELAGFIVNKAHHVDVGGKTPGSINPMAKSLYEEGVVIEPVKIVEKGELNRRVLEELLGNVRVPEYTKGDIKAQLASLNVGERRMEEIFNKYGYSTVIEAWSMVLDYGERYLLEKLRKVRGGTYSAVDFLEYGEELLKLKCTLNISSNMIIIDFKGSSKQVDAPINAVYGVTYSASCYAVKSILDPDLPMNHGILRRLRVEASLGSIVNPIKPAPVAAGNLETSQRIVDVIHLAFSKCLPGRVPAAPHGSMNNVMIGGVFDGKKWAFYETIGGGMGGRPGREGVDGVHVNMTNTLNTPIEIAEREYPILFLEYSLRENSCGHGEYRGGLGIRRVFTIRRGRAIFSLVASRIKTKPWGLMGGGPGKPGEHYVLKKDGRRISLKGNDVVELEPGDVVYIRTPGGGGYGRPENRSRELVLRDVEEGRISLEEARIHYGL